MSKKKAEEVRDFLWRVNTDKSMVSRLGKRIRDVILWLNYPQPMGALVSPSGISCEEKFTNFVMSCSPKGYKGTPVIVFTRFEGPDFDDVETRYLTNVVREHAEVAETWKGGDGDRWMWGLAVRLKRPAGSDTLRCLDDYLKGCPDHPGKGLVCYCGWYEKGKKKLNVPRKFRS
jgi:hypothetical protein